MLYTTYQSPIDSIVLLYNIDNYITHNTMHWSVVGYQMRDQRKAKLIRISLFEHPPRPVGIKSCSARMASRKTLPVQWARKHWLRMQAIQSGLSQVTSFLGCCDVLPRRSWKSILQNPMDSRWMVWSSWETCVDRSFNHEHRPLFEEFQGCKTSLGIWPMSKHMTDLLAGL